MPELVFDRFVLDTDQRLLLHGGQAVDLQPLVFDLLAFLARRPRKVISKAELLPAVWRSSFVTDSVVARAVMKARRALLDDAQEPRLLRTVPRAGYLLDADVQERPGRASRPAPAVAEGASRPRLVLLPVEDLTANPALRWVPQGLMGLLHQWLEATGHFSLAPLAEVQPVWARLTPRDDAMAQLCAGLGAAEAVRCQLAWEDEAFVLRAWRGPGAPGDLAFEARGDDVIQLTRGLVDQLDRAGAPPPAAGAAPPPTVDSFWQEQLAMVVDMQQSGQAAQALALLDTTQPHVPATPQIELLHAQLLHQCNRPDEACQVLDAALGRTDPALPDLMRVSMLALRGQCDFDADRLPQARQHLEQAVALSQRLPEAHALRPELLSRTARVAGRQVDAEAALRLAQAAVDEAGRLGQLNMQARAWLVYTALLRAMDQPYRAEEAMPRAIELAERSGVAEYQARAFRSQAALLDYQRRHTAALESVRRSLALWLRSPDRAGQQWTQLFEAWILVEAGRLDEAARALALVGRQPDLLLAHRGFLQFALAVLEWRQGHSVQALERLRAFALRARAAKSLFSVVAHAELAFMEIHLGHLDQARAAMAGAEGLPMAGALQRRQAALALAEGDRARALDLLLSVWRNGHVRGTEGPAIVIDLTWMLLENAPAGFEDPELETLFAHVLDFSDEPLEVRVLRAAYVLRQQPSDHSRAEWDQLVSGAAVLKRRCPMMLTRSYREAMASRTPPRLPELLSRVCW
ncbi:winged helix-turn-helix domain-containing protein [Aquincola tertiaricarbonis]|uniref:Winged helix-turn-helix domain-containing protein n=1 Tax=Aquincola tertiaricarbonis TaxID=391953 RepID=A0ABY4S836_AQUTE|nr:winged helix-turn-helix domain-containing protein [Aquincola tertiaricarbonis]URI08619.1 winged helix-turn-helix domain-containing protein [Aquincola tertiaricarbonis]